MSNILYSYRRCPYAIRARYALDYSGVAVRIREISLRKKPREMLQISKKGTVPVLVTDENVVIDESLEIMLWALGNQDSSDWFDVSNEEKIRDIIYENDYIFKPQLDQYKYFERYGLDKYLARANTFKWLGYIESLLMTHRYIVSNRFSLADAALFPFIRQYRGVDMNWFDKSKYTKTKAWLFNIIENESFGRVMKKYPIWENIGNPT